MLPVRRIIPLKLNIDRIVGKRYSLVDNLWIVGIEKNMKNEVMIYPAEILKCNDSSDFLII